VLPSYQITFLKVLSQNNFSWSIDFNCSIWRVYPHPSKPYLLLELRDVELRELSYLMFDIDTQSTKWKLDALPKDWLMGVEYISEQFLFLYAYLDYNNPQRLGIWVYDLDSKSLLYQNEQAHFVSFDHHRSMLTYTLEQDSDLLQTTVIGSVSLLSKAQANTCIMPFLLTIEDEKFVNMVGFAKQYLQLANIHSVEYLEIHQKIVMAIVYGLPNEWKQHIYVLNQRGEVIFEQLLHQQLKGIVNGAFFVLGHRLLFVQNNQILTAFSLS
jgi:hypothetical protein